jgi:hypothetical protein
MVCGNHRLVPLLLRHMRRAARQLYLQSAYISTKQHHHHHHHHHADDDDGHLNNNNNNTNIYIGSDDYLLYSL